MQDNMDLCLTEKKMPRVTTHQWPVVGTTTEERLVTQQARQNKDVS